MAAESMKREKVVSYLAGLSPAARDMLLRKLETAGAAGDPEARTVLEAARDLVKAVKSSEAAVTARTQPPAPRPAAPPAPVAAPAPAQAPAAAAAPPVRLDPKERFFAPFMPFVIDEAVSTRRRGWLQHSSIDPFWTYLEQQVLTDALRPWSGDALNKARVSEAEFDTAVRAMRAAAFTDMQRRIRDGVSDSRLQQRLAMYVGGKPVMADVRDMIDLMDCLPALDRLAARLPATIGATETVERLTAHTIVQHLDTRPEDAEFVASLIAARVASPLSLFRIAVAAAGTDEPGDIRGTPAEALIDVALALADRAAVRFESVWRANGDIADLTTCLRRFHDVVRGGTTVVLLQEDTPWRTRLADLRRSMSEAVSRAVDDALPALRRALRGEAGGGPNVSDAAAAARTVAIFNAAKRHREALAINELLSRLSTTIEQAIDVYGRELIEQLRRARGETRNELTAVSEYLLKMAEATHGEEFAALMRKSRDLALGR